MPAGLRAEAEASYYLNRDIWSPWLPESAIQVVLDNSDQPQGRTARAADILDLRLLNELERSGWIAAHYHP